MTRQRDDWLDSFDIPRRAMVALMFLAGGVADGVLLFMWAVMHRDVDAALAATFTGLMLTALAANRDEAHRDDGSSDDAGVERTDA